MQKNKVSADDLQALRKDPDVIPETKMGFVEGFDDSDLPIDVWSGFQVAGSAAKRITFSTTNDIDSIVSSNAADIGYPVLIKGLDINYNLKEQTVELNGQTRVALSTPLLRVYSAFCYFPFLGTITIYVNTAAPLGVPTDATKRRLHILTGNKQSQTSTITIPAGFTGLLYGGTATMLGSTPASAEAILRGNLLVRPFGTSSPSTAYVFSIKENLSVAPPIPESIPEKSDVWVELISGVGSEMGFEINYCVKFFNKKAFGLS